MLLATLFVATVELALVIVLAIAVGFGLGRLTPRGGPLHGPIVEWRPLIPLLLPPTAVIWALFVVIASGVQRAMLTGIEFGFWFAVAVAVLWFRPLQLRRRPVREALRRHALLLSILLSASICVGAGVAVFRYWGLG